MSKIASRLSVLFSLASLAAFAVGCAAPVDADDDSDVDAVESDLQTKTCPASFSLTVTDIRPTAIRGVSWDDREAFERIQSDFVEAGTIQVTRVLSEKKNGVCRYRDPSSEHDLLRSKLYGSKGHYTLEFAVKANDNEYDNTHRVYAFPTAVSTTGLTFDASDDAILDGVIGGGDSPATIVKVGLAKIEL